MSQQLDFLNASDYPGSASLPKVDRSLIKDRTESSVRQITLAGLSDIANIERWVVTGTNKQNSYLTHGLFRYFGKFPPPIAAELISEYTEPGSQISDPACGSGTSGVEAIRLGRRATVSDVNPVALLASRVKTTFVPPESVLSALESMEADYEPLPYDLEELREFGLRNPSHWFLEPTAASLHGIRVMVDALPNHDLRELLRLCFISIVRSVSRATSQQGRLFLDKDSAKEDAWASFVRQVEKARTSMEELSRFSDRNVIVEQRDLRSARNEEREKNQLVIFHPPYFNSYRYSRTNSLELAWMGSSTKCLRPMEIREFFKSGNAEKRFEYLDDVGQCLAAIKPTLKPSGVLAVMIGDTVARGEYVRIARPLIDRAESTGLRLRLLALREPRYAEASWATSLRRKTNDLGSRINDYVIVFENTP